MVGDDWLNDVHGALEAGWQALHYDPKASEPKEITISDLNTLIKLL
jgi:FMN phosphatase YigB (HAD superfamily)